MTHRTAEPTKDFETGLIVGRFHPPHLGHSWFIDAAAARCNHLVVYVNTRAGERVPGPLRAAWLQELHPHVTVVEVAHELETNWNDEELWAKWIHLFKSKWPHEHGPDAVFSSDTYIDELARRLGAVAVVVDANRVNVPISATQIRETPQQFLHFLAPQVRTWVEENWLG